MTNPELREALRDLETGKRRSPHIVHLALTPDEKAALALKLTDEIEARGHFDAGGMRYTVVEGQIKRSLPT